MSNTDAKSAPVSRGFVGLWLLSSIVPALIFMAGEYVLAAHMAESPWTKIAILLPFPIWLLLGLL